jgi:acyl-CoA synthetase (AMP-forming)/AMP-acid ligase II
LEEPPTGFGKQGSIGMTETLASYTYPDPDRSVPEGLAGCMGVPIDGCEIQIADSETLEPMPEGTEGAILVRGYFLTQGLYKQEREESFTADGFYDTGDKGYLLDGMLYFTGRHKEMIKTFGNNVAPPEVEEVLRAIPGVRDAHVLGIPDETRGEIVAALVIVDPGDPLDPGAIKEQARPKLSNYKVPRHLVIATNDELPWLATGKPDRQAIRRLLAERNPSSTAVE